MNKTESMKTPQSVRIEKAIDRLWPQDNLNIATRIRRDIIAVAQREFGIPIETVKTIFLSPRLKVHSFLSPDVAYFLRPTITHIVTVPQAATV